MSDQKFSLDDILDEYSTHGKKAKADRNKISEIDKILEDEKNTKATDEQKLNDIIIKNYPTSDIETDNKVSEEYHQVINNEPSVNNGRKDYDDTDPRKLRPVESPSAEEYLSNPNIRPINDYYDTEPKIRPMSHSTRAKEQRNANKKKRKKNIVPPSYEKDSIKNVYSSASEKKSVMTAKTDDTVDIKRAEKKEYSYAGKTVQPDIREEKQAVKISTDTVTSHYNSDEVFSINLNKDKDFQHKTSVKHTEKKPEVNTNDYTDGQAIPKPHHKKNAVHADDLRKIEIEMYHLKGTITLRMIILSITALFSVYITIANDYNLPLFDAFRYNTAPQSFVFTMLILGGIAVISSFPVIVTGLKMLFTFKADTDSLAALSVLSCIISSIFLLTDTGLVTMATVRIYFPVSIMVLLFNSIGKLMIISRAIKNISYLKRQPDKYAVTFVHDERKAETLTRGTNGDYPILASMRKTVSTSDFLRYTFSSDLADRFCRTFTPVIMILSLIAAVVCMVRLGGDAGIFADKSTLTIGASVFAMCINACACFAVTMVSNIPLLSASKKLSKSGVMLGYQSVDDFYDTNSVLVNASDLFPKGMVNLSAIKPYSDVKIDDAILLAASLSIHAGSVMTDMFKGMIGSNERMLYPVENIEYEDSMGVCGWINNKRVLLGSRALMNSHSIEGIPSKTKEFEYIENGKSAVYLSVSGNLAAMFIIELNANLEVKEYVKELRDDNICLIIKSTDSFISVSKVSRLFKMPEDNIKIISEKLHKYFSSETSPVNVQSSSMVCDGQFTSFARLLLSAKSIRQASMLGIILQAASAILGFVIAAVFIAMDVHSYSKISVSALLIYNLIWMVISVILVKLKRV